MGNFVDVLIKCGDEKCICQRPIRAWRKKGFKKHRSGLPCLKFSQDGDYMTVHEYYLDGSPFCQYQQIGPVRHGQEIIYYQNEPIVWNRYSFGLRVSQTRPSMTRATVESTTTKIKPDAMSIEKYCDGRLVESQIISQHPKGHLLIN